MSEPVGIIHPPPDLRGIVDSTAKYVAKNGGAFEQRIMREHKDKPKFRFLFSDDPFNAYYRHKVKEIKASLLGNDESLASKEQDERQHQHDPDSREASNKDETSQSRLLPKISTTSATSEINYPDQYDAANDDYRDHGRVGDSNGAISSENHVDANEHRQNDNLDKAAESELNNDGTSSRVRPKLNEYIQEMTMKLVEPPTLNHLASSAPSLTRLDCDIIKLSSQFIATHGRSFLLELVGREHSNSRFDFLKPQHGQFTFMTNLIMQYALIQNPPLDVLEQLENDATNQKGLFDRIKMRAEWTRMLEMEKKKKEEAEEREKLLYSQIDWHDFVVVETIDFRPDEIGKYPPTTADQVGTRLLLQQRSEDQVAAEEMEIDMDMDSDQDSHAGGDDDESSKIEQQPDGDFAIPDPPDAARVVIKNYDPKASTKQAPQPDNYYVSPLTNERIPVDKIHEHLRYNLSDPRYLEKKDQMLQERMNEETVFASGSQIQDSLKNLAERRTDIFGMNDAETAIGHRIGEENQLEKPKEDRLIWDGHKSSLKKKKLN